MKKTLKEEIERIKNLSEASYDEVLKKHKDQADIEVNLEGINVELSIPVAVVHAKQKKDEITEWNPELMQSLMKRERPKPITNTNDAQNYEYKDDFTQGKIRFILTYGGGKLEIITNMARKY